MLTCPARENLFHNLILPNRAMLAAQAGRLTNGNKDEAEDLVQETLIRAYTRLDNITCEATIKGWLCTTLRNLYFSQYKKRARSPQSLTLDSVTEDTLSPLRDCRADLPERVVLKRLQNRAILAALATLPPPYREAVVLADLEGMSYQDIADGLQLPVGTVRSRLARGRRRIRRSLYAWSHSTPLPKSG